MMHGLQKRIISLLAPTMAALLVGYFVYHLIQGERGLFAWMRLEKELKESEGHLEKLRARNESVINRIQGLKKESLDSDLLEERARVSLGFADPKDIVIVVPNYKLSQSEN